jgi:hypothetical protein
MSTTVSIQTYVSPSTEERWLKHADEMGMNKSQFVQAMVEAGLKKFTRDVNPDQTAKELREHVAELTSALREAREYINRLEERQMAGEHQVVVEYVEENPGCTFRNIADHLALTAPSRATKVLEVIEGDEVAIDESGQWYRND